MGRYPNASCSTIVKELWNYVNKEHLTVYYMSVNGMSVQVVAVWKIELDRDLGKLRLRYSTNLETKPIKA